MKSLHVKDNDLMQLAIQDEISRSEEARYDHRLHGMLLVSKGLNCYEVSELLGQNPTTIQRWVNRFSKKGFAGLYEGEHPGRPKKLSEKQWGMLGKDLRRNPRDMSYMLAYSIFLANLWNYWCAPEFSTIYILG